MEQTTSENQIFEKSSWAGKTVKGHEFLECVFEKCDLSNSNFSGNKFIDCTFQGCNLSGMKVPQSTLLNARFIDCKILGVKFNECKELLFSVFFEASILDYSTFMGRKMVQTKFVKSSLKEVNFIQANLAGSLFDQCDLSAAFFNETDLSGVNFVTAYNYSIDPELNKLKKASFSEQGLAGLLGKYGINIV
jgi:uncharacterized protein YjbI with pentapeptide repeats